MKTRRTSLVFTGPVALVVVIALGVGAFKFYRSALNAFLGRPSPGSGRTARPSAGLERSSAVRRPMLDTSGLVAVCSHMPSWKPDSSLEEISTIWRGASQRGVDEIDRLLGAGKERDNDRVALVMTKAGLLNFSGEAEKAYEVLTELRSFLDSQERLRLPHLASVIYFQGVSALRRGENDNCIMCRAESACILPISASAVHSKPTGSRLAIEHFTEYLTRFPDDLGVRWLLNLAHMTLGEYPDRVDPRFRLNLKAFFQSSFDIGRFHEAARLVGLNRFNSAGGAIMEDFDDDGLLDVAVTSFSPNESMSYHRNKGDGTFEDRSREAGLTDQLGGMVCYQADYDNDGRMDIFVPRGAWLPYPIRPSLLRNAGAGVFSDVTRGAGLLDPVNSNAAAWSDYDNDGWIDLYVGCERQTNRLYRNKGNGTFEEVAAKAGVLGDAGQFCKGCTWVDYDNDGYPDLFLNNALAGRLFHNNCDGTFTESTSPMGIDGPRSGFSCWTWDYDNDGWLDIFATCFDRTLADVVKGLIGESHGRYSNRLYRNLKGKGFENVTQQAGLDMVFSTMGSNYGDFDNDGWLDMYLGTGEPNLATLVPNRMFKNVGGERFAEITGTSGTGHLQKGHGIACGDWDRDGDVDLFVQTGGAADGDKYHNLLFQNPGQGNHWLTVKLVGKKTNRAAIGARIKIITAGEKPLSVHRHVSSGSSYGASPLQQTIGLATAERVAVLEIHWPTSGTTQVFRDVVANHAIEVTEFAESYRHLDWAPLQRHE
jgi:FG-GAP-like repeat/ASPIC and UnbV